MKNNNLGVYIAVISAHRPKAVMTLPVGYATWYVPKSEVDVYRNAGAESVREDGGGLCQARNTALRDAWALGLPCVQVSDDLKKIEVINHLVEPRPKPAVISFEKAIRTILEEMETSPAKLGGVSPTDNPFYFKRPVSKNNFVIGDLIVVKPCELFFDEKLKLKEDYDYTLQHLTNFGEVVRVDYVLANFLHRDNKGGAVAVRTPKLEQDSIEYLKSKWGDFIKPNPRRANEILLNTRKFRGSQEVDN